MFIPSISLHARKLIMNRVAALLALIFVSLQYASAQHIEPQRIFSYVQAIEQEKTTFFELEGYQFFIQLQEIPLSTKGLKKLKRKYKISPDAVTQTRSGLPQHHYVETTETRDGDVTQTNVHYFFALSQERVRVISFSTVLSRDTLLEQFFIRSLAEGRVPRQVHTSMNTDSIPFAGRHIYLGPACGWRSIRNIQCPNYGQMNWSEFREESRAREMVRTQHALNLAKSMMKVQRQDSVSVRFEGYETRALRSVYRVNVPQLIMGGSNILIVYYVVAPVRGRYVACILSQYTDDVQYQGLAPLLREVMERMPASPDEPVPE